ncbi:MAG: hypothetical protein WBX22_26290 [Silvibacterium sp.]
MASTILFRTVFLAAIAAMVLFLTCGSVSQAQQITGIGNTTSTPVPGVPHDYLSSLNEVVNPANGSVSIRIKAPTPHERGVNWPTYAFMYDSDGIYTLIPTWFTSGGSTSFTALTWLNINWAQVPQVGGQTQTLNTTLPSGNNVTTTYSCTVSYGYVFTDPDGGRHGLGLGVTSVPSGAPSNSCSYFPAFSNQYVGGDEQYKATVNPSTLAVTVMDLHGNAVELNKNIVENSPLGSPAPEDVNGNLFNTTGRTWSTTSSSSGYSMTVPGVTEPYTATYGPSFVPSFSLNLTPVEGNSSSGDACQATSISPLNGPSGSRDPANTAQAKTLTLPNGETYQFGYDPTYGLINKITYPTGAWVEYTWSIIPNAEGVQYRTMGSGAGALCAITHDWFAITKRVVSYDGATSDEEQDFSYATTWPASGQANSYKWTSKTTTVTTKDLLRGTQFNTVYTYSPMLPPPESVTAWEDLGYVPQEQSIVYNDTNGSLLKTVTKTWQTMNLLSGECETLPNSQTSGKFYVYAPYNAFGGALNPGAAWTNLPTDISEYDYGAVSSNCTKPSSTAIRETKTTYASFGNTPLFSYASFLDRPQTVQVYGNGTLLSETDYAYDGGTAPTGVGNVAPSTVTPTPYGQDPQYETASITTRGNPTTVTKKCFVGSTNCSNSVSTYTYDTTGQVLSAKDAKGYTTSYYYTDNYTTDNGSPPGSTNAYVTKITDAASHITHYEWGFEDGKLRLKTDENNQQTKFCYWTGGCSGTGFDAFYRLTGVNYPDTGQEKVTYSDAGPTPSVTTQTLQSGSTWITKETIYDAYGHPTQTELLNAGGGTDYVTTTYDGLAHAWTVTNPYYSTSDATYGKTTYTYDALDRRTSQTQPDNTATNPSVLQWCYNGVASQGQSNCLANQSSQSTHPWVDSSDETGRHWQQVSDGLGRLTAVMEPNSSNIPALETDYGYDALGNLLRVDQWGGANGSSGDRLRTFSYDSLSRLLSATNPETGTVSYSYDANSNVISKTDARGVVTAFAYDALNRLLSKSYPSDPNKTPAACYQYDLASLGIGRLANQWTQSTACQSTLPTSGVQTSRLILAYDPMGRVTSEQQCVLSNCVSGTTPYSLAYTYDLAGHITSYPNGISSIGFTNAYDGVGRLQTITSSWDDATHPPTIFSAQTASSSPCGQTPSYTAFGGLMNAVLGNGLTLSRSFDKRLRSNCETDTGSVVASPTSSSATVAITGSEQSQ